VYQKRVVSATPATPTSPLHPPPQILRLRRGGAFALDDISLGAGVCALGVNHRGRAWVPASAGTTDVVCAGDVGGGACRTRVSAARALSANPLGGEGGACRTGR